MNIQKLRKDIPGLKETLDKVNKALTEEAHKNPVKPKILCDFTGVEIEGPRKINTGVAEVLEYISDEALEPVKDYAKVACLKCAKVIAYLKPGTDSDGFTLKKGVVYHITRCPGCDPDYFLGRTVETPMVEKEVFLQRKNK